MITDDRIREICARVVKSRDGEFQKALAELQEAIESRLNSDPQKDGQ